MKPTVNASCGALRLPPSLRQRAKRQMQTRAMTAAAAAREAGRERRTSSPVWARETVLFLCVERSDIAFRKPAGAGRVCIILHEPAVPPTHGNDYKPEGRGLANANKNGGEIR